MTGRHPMWPLMAAAVSLLASAAAAQTSPNAGECAPDSGEALYLRRVVPEKADVVMYGRGFKKDYLYLVDGLPVNPTQVSEDTARFPMELYPGKKQLPATVQFSIEARDGSVRSNVCDAEYPGDFPFFVAVAAGLSNRHGDPAALVLGFLGLPGSAQERVPSWHSDGRRKMSSGARFLRRLYIVGGVANAANTEGAPFALGVGIRLSGDFKFIYACRFNQDDYPHHIFGFAGTVNVQKLTRKF